MSDGEHTSRNVPLFCFGIIVADLFAASAAYTIGGIISFGIYTWIVIFNMYVCATAYYFNLIVEVTSFVLGFNTKKLITVLLAAKIALITVEAAILVHLTFFF